MSVEESAALTDIARATSGEHLREAENELVSGAGQFVRHLTGTQAAETLRSQSSRPVRGAGTDWNDTVLLGEAGSATVLRYVGGTRDMTDSSGGDRSPLFGTRDFESSSVFTPEFLLREARRQKDLPERSVPPVCVLDPDGDVVRRLRTTGRAERDPTWPGYHTDLYRFTLDGTEVGIVGCAVGAPFAVLVAEQLFATGCRFLVSITSSGQIVPRDDPPYFVLIDRALRDEGTSHHYRPPSRYATLPPDLRDRVEAACRSVSRPVYTGATWTTDAPFRETEAAIERARSEGVLAVEMEAAALYTFAGERNRSVVCFAYVTNEMGQGDSEFEKGDADGSTAALDVIDAAIAGWRGTTGDE